MWSGIIRYPWMTIVKGTHRVPSIRLSNASVVHFYPFERRYKHQYIEFPKGPFHIVDSKILSRSIGIAILQKVGLTIPVQNTRSLWDVSKEMIMSNEDDVFLSECTHWRYRQWYSSSFLSRYEYSNDLTISNNILAKCKILGRVEWRHIEFFCIVNWSVDIELRRDKIVYVNRIICRSRSSCNESLSITRHLRSVRVSIWYTLRIPRSAKNPIAFVSLTFVFFTIRWRRCWDVKDTRRRVRLSTCVGWQTRGCLSTYSSWRRIWLH